MKQYITGQIAYKSDSQSEPYGCRNFLSITVSATLKKGQSRPRRVEKGNYNPQVISNQNFTN